MQIHPIKTDIIETKDTIYGVIDQYLNQLDEESIVAITSKIISLTHNCLVAKKKITKYELICQEADALLIHPPPSHGIQLTIKNSILLPSAGIDESNINPDYYITYPKDIQKIAVDLWKYLRRKHRLTKVGIIITDSHTTMMRRGVMGIALAWSGLSPLYSYINTPDLHNHPLKSTQINVLDSLAASAVVVMGEGNEQQPIAIIRDIPRIVFLNHGPSKNDMDEVILQQDNDIYAPILRCGKWLYNQKLAKNRCIT